MYAAFRANGQPLPGDEEVLKNQKPNEKVTLRALSDVNAEQRLDDLETTIFVQGKMTIEAIKKYIFNRLKTAKLDNFEEIELFSANSITLGNEMSIKDVQKIMEERGFNAGHLILSYSKVKRDDIS